MPSCVFLCNPQTLPDIYQVGKNDTDEGVAITVLSLLLSLISLVCNIVIVFRAMDKNIWCRSPFNIMENPLRATSLMGSGFGSPTHYHPKN